MVVAAVECVIGSVEGTSAMAASDTHSVGAGPVHRLADVPVGSLDAGKGLLGLL